jgi:hypothetical protein
MLLHHYERYQGGGDGMYMITLARLQQLTRSPAACAYAQRAFEMGAALNLNDDATIRLLSNTEDGQLRLRALWEAIRQ